MEIMNMLCTPGDGCKICDDIERYFHKYIKNGSTNDDIALDIAKRIIIAEVECIRELRELNSTYDPNFSTEKDLIDALNNDTKSLLHYVENMTMDMFDYERYITTKIMEEELLQEQEESIAT